MERFYKPANFTTLSLRQDKYSGIPLDKDFCPYTFHLYPSDLMKADFETSNGAIFMVSTFGIFLFTSLVFFLYDWKVERRQNRVTITARRSSALLSSLFPSTVGNQLYEKQADSANNTKRQWRLHSSPSSSGDEQLNEQTGVNPIAQLYDETTVIFMDIVGFTQWSSSRQPTDVFKLLETLYAKFDALAKVHRVFKIETIGDCYVALVGLPSKRKRHAVIMSYFAYDCRESMMGILKQLEKSLGPVCDE
jgi:Adenylate and Guanylate cyclase catalytic domain